MPFGECSTETLHPPASEDDRTRKSSASATIHIVTRSPSRNPAMTSMIGAMVAVAARAEHRSQKLRGRACLRSHRGRCRSRARPGTRRRRARRGLRTPRGRRATRRAWPPSHRASRCARRPHPSRLCSSATRRGQAHQSAVSTSMPCRTPVQVGSPESRLVTCVIAKTTRKKSSSGVTRCSCSDCSCSELSRHERTQP